MTKCEQWYYAQDRNFQNAYPLDVVKLIWKAALVEEQSIAEKEFRERDF